MDAAQNIIEKLRNNNFEAFLVGGCVRDLLLCKQPSDFDVTTNAHPDEVLNIFKDYKTFALGKKFGTITVLVEDEKIEITTYRSESTYSDNRHPDEVIFSDDLREDLKRRDFTINAMAMYNGEVFDFYNGQEDLKAKIIRCVGKADERFQEDALRMIRAIRFSTLLYFTIEKTTFDAIVKNAHLIQNVANERIKDELNKILLSEKPSYGIRVFAETGLLKYILPDLEECIDFEQKSSFHDKTVFDHILTVLDNTKPELKQRLAALFHDIAKPKTFSVDEKGQGHFYGHDTEGMKIAQRELKKFGYSNEMINDVLILISEHMKIGEMTDKALRRKIRRAGKENITALYDLLIADRISTKSGRTAEDLIKEKHRIEELLKEETANEKFLKINGNDLKALGYIEGKEIGNILRELEELVLDDPKLNEKEILIKLIKNRGLYG